MGHYFALPLAEALQEQYRVIALSVPQLLEFSLSGTGLATIMEHENVTCCHAIGHSNGGVRLCLCQLSFMKSSTSPIKILCFIDTVLFIFSGK